MSEKVRKKVNRDIFGNGISSQSESAVPANDELAGQLLPGRQIQGGNSLRRKASRPPTALAGKAPLLLSLCRR